jgi:putative ABC transport system substrate-binding protein
MTVVSAQFPVVSENTGAKSMSGKIFIWLLATVLLTTVSPAQAQQATKIPRIGYLSPGASASPPSSFEAFRRGLHELGYLEGKNIVIKHVFAEGRNDRLTKLATELVTLKVDVIVVVGGQAAEAAKQATNSIPIVFTLVNDPIKAGLVASHARPGGNATGLTSVSQDISGKRLELLKEAIPKVSRVAVMYDPGDPAKILEFKEAQTAAAHLQMQLQALEVRSVGEFDSAFKTATRAKIGAVLVLPTSILISNQKQIAELALKNRLPTMFAYGQLMDRGGLMSYGPDYTDLNRRAATYVDKILKGSKPGDLPVEWPMKFELFINLKTAKEIGLTIPPNVLARADKVIK